MKILTRLAGLILIILWAATFGFVGMMGWLPIFIISPAAAEKWFGWFAKTGNIPCLMLTNGEETL